MLLNAGCNIEIDAAAPSAAILMMRPASGPAQDIRESAITIDPQTSFVDCTDLYGNFFQRTILPQGRSVISATCSAEVADTIDVDMAAPFTPVNELPDYALHYLLPSRFCPSDLMLTQANKIIEGAAPGYAQVEAIRSWINRKVKYKYGSSGPTTTALDTAKSRKGVCRDFAHLGISLCRAVRIPARMVSGYLYKLDPMDLHVWFEAFVGGRWYTFDATQKDPRGGRIAVAYGRDVADIALMSEYGPLKLGKMEVWVNRAK